MDRIRVRTKYNKTGWRVLTLPIDDEKLCVPANQVYRQRCNTIEAEFKKKKDKPLQEYVGKVSHFVASYLASNCASYEDRYRITRFLAECGGIGEHMDSECWWQQLGDMPGLSQVREEARQTYAEVSSRLWKEREDALREASHEHDVMKRALRKEYSNQIHRETHPEEDRPIE